MPATDDVLDACLDALYGSLQDPNRFSAAVLGLDKVFDVNRVAFLRARPDGTLATFIASDIDPEANRLYVEHYVASDPARPHVIDAPVGRWFQDDRLLDPAFNTRSPYVNEFCRQFGIRWFRGGKVFESESMKAFLSVMRPADDKPFEAATMQAMERVQPHLSRVTRLLGDLDRHLPHFAATRAAFDQAEVAMFVVDGEARLRHANPAAEALLHVPGPLVQAHGRLSSADAAHADTLKAAVRQATSFPRRASSYCPNAFAPLAQVLQVRVVPLEADFAGAGTSFALVFVTQGPARVDVRELGMMFGLTAAEAALVLLLARGRTPAECAALRGTSISTVRTHLASVYVKTGTASQAQLLSLVLALPGFRAGDTADQPG